MLNSVNFFLKYNFIASNLSPASFCKRVQLLNLRNITTLKFEKVADETLESLSEYFDDLIEKSNHLPDTDVTLSSGVLTVNFGKKNGTYVINKQTPNTQIWLSSPISGPKRYDYYSDLDAWIYRRDNRSLHQLLQIEIPQIVERGVKFYECVHSGHKDCS